METRVDKVAEKHKSGYNCAQAVACAYCDLVGIDEETMFRLTEGLGLGMGRHGRNMWSCHSSLCNCRCQE